MKEDIKDWHCIECLTLLEYQPFEILYLDNVSIELQYCTNPECSRVGLYVFPHTASLLKESHVTTNR